MADKDFNVSGNSVTGTHSATRGIDSIKISGSTTKHGTTYYLHAYKGSNDACKELVNSDGPLSADLAYSICENASTVNYKIKANDKSVCAGADAHTRGSLTGSNGELNVNAG